MSIHTGKKGIGIIGYGGFGEFIRTAWDQMDSVKVVAVCDSDPGRAPIDIDFYQQVGPLLANPAVDIVSIATPPNSHKDLAIIAMEAGKHVIIEKPLALSESDALLIKEASERTKRIATVDFMLRFNPIVEMLHEIVNSEVLGKLRRVDLRNYAMRDQVPEGHWFWNPHVSGRILLEHGVHFFDIAHWITNSKAASVSALGIELKPGMEDKVFAAVTYQNNAVGTFWHSFSRPRVLETTTFHFAFDLGEIDMIGWIPLELNMWGWTDKHGLDKIKSLQEDIDLVAARMDPTKAQSSEHLYSVEYDINATIRLADDKMEVYADNLRSIMGDLVKAIDNPSHTMRVTLDDAIEAVRVAEMATKFVHPEEELTTPKLQADVLKA